MKKLMKTHSVSMPVRLLDWLKQESARRQEEDGLKVSVAGLVREAVSKMYKQGKRKGYGKSKSKR